MAYVFFTVLWKQCKVSSRTVYRLIAIVVITKVKEILSGHELEVVHKCQVHNVSFHRQVTTKRTRLIQWQIGVLGNERHEQHGKHIFLVKKFASVKVQVDHERLVNVVAAKELNMDSESWLNFGNVASQIQHLCISIEFGDVA